MERKFEEKASFSGASAATSRSALTNRFWRWMSWLWSARIPSEVKRHPYSSRESWCNPPRTGF